MATQVHEREGSHPLAQIGRGRPDPARDQAAAHEGRPLGNVRGTIADWNC